MTPASDERAARELPVLNAKLSERVSGLHLAPIALTIGFPDTTDAAHRFAEWYKPTDWMWWGRGFGVFLGILVKEREAAVRTAYADELRARIETLRLTPDATDVVSSYEMVAFNNAIAKVLAALDPEGTDG